MRTPMQCQKIIDSLQQAGVDEVAALIDFGVEFDWVMESLDFLKDLKNSYTSIDRVKTLVS